MNRPIARPLRRLGNGRAVLGEIFISADDIAIAVQHLLDRNVICAKHDHEAFRHCAMSDSGTKGKTMTSASTRSMAGNGLTMDLAKSCNWNSVLHRIYCHTVMTVPEIRPHMFSDEADHDQLPNGSFPAITAPAMLQPQSPQTALVAAVRQCRC